VIVKSLVAAFVFVAMVWGDDQRTRFDRLKAEAREAAQVTDWAKAEARYRQLLQLAPSLQVGAYEMYAEIVSPLAEIYKKSEAVDKLEALYQQRVDQSGEGLERGLAQADLGFFYQGSDFASADRFLGEQLVEKAVESFEHCAAGNRESDQCRKRLADTAGIQGAMFFQKLDYKRAEPLFRRVITMPDGSVQDEVMLVSLHALRGILILRKEYDEARQLELRAAAFEAAHPNALSRLKGESARGRKSN
jgi:tetratricopeptide (TPR) repeat protein